LLGRWEAARWSVRAARYRSLLNGLDASKQMLLVVLVALKLRTTA